VALRRLRKSIEGWASEKSLKAGLPIGIKYFTAFEKIGVQNSSFIPFFGVKFQKSPLYQFLSGFGILSKIIWQPC
jgi:hypothetical protein